MSRYIPVEPEKWGEMVKAMAENARLKAEVERLRASSFVTAVPVEEYEKLKAEVERLRKAGDAMADAFPSPNFPREHYALKAWNAAKEGKPQP